MTKDRTYCIYCGTPDPDTWDHIPPACLFPLPRPSNLITVPSCTACNSGASKDDEYFKIWLLMRHDIAGHPTRAKLLDSVYRGLAKPQKRKLLNMLLSTLRRVPVHTPAGLYLGDAGVYYADLSRFSKVADRIVKGLFFHHYRTRLAATHDVRSFAESGLRDIKPTLQRSLAEMITALRSKPKQTIGEHVFEYWFQATPEDPNSTAWLLKFYDAESFLCLTARTGDPVPAAQPMV